MYSVLSPRIIMLIVKTTTTKNLRYRCISPNLESVLGDLNSKASWQQNGFRLQEIWSWNIPGTDTVCVPCFSDSHLQSCTYHCPCWEVSPSSQILLWHFHLVSSENFQHSCLATMKKIIRLSYIVRFYRHSSHPFLNSSQRWHELAL